MISKWNSFFCRLIRESMHAGGTFFLGGGERIGHRGVRQ